MENRTKVIFEYQNFEDEYSLESMWTIKQSNGYKIDNIPFYVKGFALGDVVSVAEKEGELYAVDLVEESGHSTIQIIFNDVKDVPQSREYLQKSGCDSEISDVPFLLAVDIPPSTPYQIIKEYLDQGEEDEKWGYQEACLSQ